MAGVLGADLWKKRQSWRQRQSLEEGRKKGSGRGRNGWPGWRGAAGCNLPFWGVFPFVHHLWTQGASVPAGPELGVLAGPAKKAG